MEFRPDVGVKHYDASPPPENCWCISEMMHIANSSAVVKTSLLGDLCVLGVSIPCEQSGRNNGMQDDGRPQQKAAERGSHTHTRQ
jgi:hypothetical protein